MLCVLSSCLMALATAACNPVADQYFREGAGSDLYTAQLPQETQLQDQYVYYICRQTRNPGEEGTDGSSCVTDWTAFTLAGMNDIDRRCDAYLDWLDAQRRDRTPILTQIAALGGSAGAIMGVAGAGTQALSIVATAFGLAGTTYANWNSRLLLDVDHSTVQTIVYTRQQDFRKANVGVIVPDRPAAIYLLRGYLRICMPITIETTINTNVDSRASRRLPDGYSEHVSPEGSFRRGRNASADYRKAGAERSDRRYEGGRGRTRSHRLGNARGEDDIAH